MLGLLRQPFCLFAFLFLDYGLGRYLLSKTSAHSPSGALPVTSGPLNLSLLLYNCEGFALGHSWMAMAAGAFPCFPQFKPECGTEFVI